MNFNYRLLVILLKDWQEIVWLPEPEDWPPPHS
jgi:hypothetical protein